jgi:hypothetical protein
MNTLKRKLPLLIALALVAAAVSGVSVAVAQDPDQPDTTLAQPDAGSDEPSGPDTLIVTTCRTDINHFVRTENAPSTIGGAAFLTLTSTSITVPAGESRCVIVTFSAETACSGDQFSGDDFCYVRAIDLNTGVRMNPADDVQAFDSESSTARTHAKQWVQRVGAGQHTFAIQRRTDGGNTQFFTDDWTFTTSVYF